MITAIALILFIAFMSIAIAAIAVMASRTTLPPFITRSTKPETGNLVDDPEWLKLQQIMAKHEQGVQHNYRAR